MFTILALSLAFVTGFTLVAWIAPRLGFFEQAMLSFPIGLFIETLLMLLGTMIFKLPFTVGTIILYSGIIIISSLVGSFVTDRFATYQKIPQDLKDFLRSRSQLHWYEVLGLLGLLAIALLIIAKCLYWPVYMWDSIAYYDYDALLYATFGSIEETARSFGSEVIVQYPPYVPLAHTFMYVLHSTVPKAIYGCLFVSLLGFFYCSLRRYCSRFLSQIITLLLGIHPLITTYAPLEYTNFPLTLYYSAGVIYVYHWIKQQDLSLLIIGTLFILGAFFVRTETFYFLCSLYASFGLFCLISKNKKYWLYFALFVLVTWNFSKIWNQYYYNVIEPYPRGTYMTYDVERVGGEDDYRSTLGFGYTKENLQKITDYEHMSAVIPYFYTAVKSALSHLRYLFLLVLLFNIPYLKRENFYMFLIVILNLGIMFAGTFAVSIIADDWKEITGSAIRLFMLTIPVIMFYIGTSYIVKRTFKCADKT